MTNRLTKVIHDLEYKGYSFDVSQLEKTTADKFVGDITREGEEYLLYLVINEQSEKAVNITKEAKLLNHLKTLTFVPRVIEFSEQGLYLIREKLSGEISGNVYSFSREAVNNNGFVSDLVGRITVLWLMKKESFLPKFDLNIVLDKISNIKKDQKELSDLCDKVLTQFEKNANLIQDCPAVFLHGDLQPTNIMITKDGLYLIDFELAAYGPVYYDLASLYHRFDEYGIKQAELMEMMKDFFQKQDLAFDHGLFDTFYSYYLLIDIASLDSVYIQKAKKLFHNTKIDVKAATELKAHFLNKLNSLFF